MYTEVFFLFISVDVYIDGSLPSSTENDVAGETTYRQEPTAECFVRGGCSEQCRRNESSIGSATGCRPQQPTTDTKSTEAALLHVSCNVSGHISILSAWLYGEGALYRQPAPTKDSRCPSLLAPLTCSQ